LLLGGLNEQRTLALTIYQRGVVQSDYGLASAMSVVLLVLAVVVSYVSLRYSRDALV
jgi:ABC-type sugar transport system permease subunit